MKKIATIVLLICISARPVYQISYVAYFELNIDYIVEKYCINKERPKLECNGKCHLTKQLSMGETGPNEQNHQEATLVEAFFPLFFQVYVYRLGTLTAKTVNEPIISDSKYWNSICGVVPSPPPKV